MSKHKMVLDTLKTSKKIFDQFDPK